MAKPFLPEVTESADSIRVAWDNRRAPRDRSHLRLLLLLGPVLAACGTVPAWLTFFGPEHARGNWLERIVAVVIGALWWVVAVLVGYDLVGRRWAERVEVSATAITVGRRGFLAPTPKVIAVGPGVELFLGVCDDGYERAPRPSLEVFSPGQWGGRTRIEFGRWLAVPAREQVFETLAAFIASHRIPVKVTRIST